MAALDVRIKVTRCAAVSPGRAAPVKLCGRAILLCVRRGGSRSLLPFPDVRGDKVDQLRRHCNHLGRGVTARTQLIEERPSEDLGGLRVSAHRAGAGCHTRATTSHHCNYMKYLD